MFSLPSLGLSATHIRRTITSLAASSGMHVLLLATLAVVVVRANQTAAPPTPLGAGRGLPTIVGAGDEGGIDGSLAGATLPQHAARAPSAGPTSASVASNSRFLLPSSGPAEFDPAGLLPAEPSSLERMTLPGEEEDGDGDRAGGDESPGAGGGQNGPGHSFFGLEASGDRVVFVVDISGSMSGRRFYRARTELRRSIESLRPDQQYFVIFFNDGALPMPAEKLLPATPENVAETLHWLNYVKCGGGTNPLPGMLLALQLHPDAIYLMTDGKFDPQIVWEVTQAEPTVPIPVFTISFASRSAERLLKQIAAETGGSYRFAR
jgi:von Willebrand factor type A domain